MNLERNEMPTWERMKEKRNEGGFTLIELLIVIIILAILAAIVVFAVGGTATNAKVAACNSDAKSVETALEAYKAQSAGTYPTALSALTTSTLSGTTTIGPWLRQVPAADISDNGYSIIYPGATSGEVDVAVSGGTSNYDGATNPCDAA